MRFQKWEIANNYVSGIGKLVVGEIPQVLSLIDIGNKYHEDF